MKRFRVSIIMGFAAAVAMLCLVGCGSSGAKDTLENQNMALQGAYIDESYAGSEDDSDKKRLYIFAEVTASTGTLKVRAASFELTITREDATDTLNSTDVIMKDSDGGSAVTNLASSYTCSKTYEEVSPGSSAKIAIPFNVPDYYLQEGATFSLSYTSSGSDDIAEGITFGFDYIQDSDNLETIAQSVDEEGYSAAMTAREDASPEVAQQVMNALNHYEYFLSVGGLTTTYSFEGDRFTAKVAGKENPGTYVVKNGYLACRQDSTGWITWIPWEFSDKSQNGISIDIEKSFTEK